MEYRGEYIFYLFSFLVCSINYLFVNRVRDRVRQCLRGYAEFISATFSLFTDLVFEFNGIYLGSSKCKLTFSRFFCLNSNY